MVYSLKWRVSEFQNCDLEVPELQKTRTGRSSTEIGHFNEDGVVE
jgi:hypothetical protein